MKPNQERLKELLSYDPLTGVFLWKVDRSNIKRGTLAGRYDKAGYIRIGIDGREYRAHRLAWLYMTGEWPEIFLDHRDMDKNNNAWSNLRLATKSQNAANIGPLKSNTSGIKGVSFHSGGAKGGKPWQANITKNGKAMGLGIFATKEEARAAYAAAAERLFGEFARAA